MEKKVTISLSEEIISDLDVLARDNGLSADEIIIEAIKNYIFVRKFRTLAEQMTSEADERGIYSEQDVFDRVSGI